MSRMTLGLVLALAACAAPRPEGGAYRDPSAPISSAALFAPARFAGEWHQVAAFGAEAACGAVAEAWQATGPGRFRVTGQVCDGGRVRAGASDAAVTGPGRITRSGGETLWVLWVDADYRVAAIGTPSGGFGRILSRDPVPRADLMTAAREVLDFNGYDISRLVLAR